MNMNWEKAIYDDICLVSEANPGKKIVIFVSPLMMDYLHYKYVETQPIMAKEHEEIKERLKDKQDENAIVKTLFGYELRVVNEPDIPTFCVMDM